MNRRDLLRDIAAFSTGVGAHYFGGRIYSQAKSVQALPNTAPLGEKASESVDIDAVIAEIVSKPSIGTLAKSKGYVFGSSAHNYLFRDPIVEKTLSHHCNSFVCEVAMKLAKIRKEPDVWDFSNVQRFIDYTVSENLSLRGHVLCWHAVAPKWYVDEILNGNKYQVFSDNLRFLLTYFKGKVSSWDVVNEVIKPQDGQANGFRNSFLYQAFGEDFVRMAFESAYEFDPNTPRYLTEYFGSEGEWAGKKITSFMKLIDSLVEKNVPITGVGIHGHLVTSKWIPEQQLYRLVKHVHDAGLDIMVTELDVRDYDLPEDMGKREDIIVPMLSDYLSIMSSFDNYKGLMCWGLFDQYSWTNMPKYSKQRDDSTPHSATLFDSSYKAKARVDTIYKHFQELPSQV